MEVICRRVALISAGVTSDICRTAKIYGVHRIVRSDWNERGYAVGSVVIRSE